MDLKYIKRYSLLLLKNDLFQSILLAFLAILIPFIFKGPQLLVGSVVNFLFTFGILKFGFKKILPSLFLPSLVAFGSNVLFGGATSFLLFFVPIIFLSNIVYVLLFKYLNWGVFNVLISSAVKSLILFISAFILVKELGLPTIFLSSMGYIQFITATIGGVLAFTTDKLLS